MPIALIVSLLDDEYGISSESYARLLACVNPKFVPVLQSVVDGTDGRFYTTDKTLAEKLEAAEIASMCD